MAPIDRCERPSDQSPIGGDGERRWEIGENPKSKGEKEREREKDKTKERRGCCLEAYFYLFYFNPSGRREED